MLAVDIVVDDAAVLSGFAGLSDLNTRRIQTAGGRAGVEQIKRRIRTEKSAPDGRRWAAWSTAYATTREPGKHSLLIDTGELLESITISQGPVATFVGTGQSYAEAVHAKRPFVGVSDDNARELEIVGGEELAEILIESWR